jgi:multiple sugar transport system permease protein
MKFKLGRKINDKLFAWELIAPSIICLTVLSFYPFWVAFQTSFYNINTISRKTTYIGLANYAWALNSPDFWDALQKTVVWSFSGVALQLILGLIFSLVLHQELKGRNIARGLILFPYLIPAIVGAIVWRFMLNPSLGIVNYLLVDVMHILDHRMMWLFRPNTAMLAVIIVGVWKFVPFMVILLLARLQTTPMEIFDAAKIDGANAWQLFWFITIPWIKPTILVALMLRTIWMFNHFDMVYLMAYGGPMKATTTIPVLIRDIAFADLKMGRSAAVSMYMVVILIIASIVYTTSYMKAEEDIAG